MLGIEMEKLGTRRSRNEPKELGSVPGPETDRKCWDGGSFSVSMAASERYANAPCGGT